MDVFTDYLAAISDACHRKKMQEVLDWVRTAFPSLAPRMGWNQPMFTDHGTFIIGFSVSKQHFAVSPEKKGMMEFSKKLNKPDTATAPTSSGFAGMIPSITGCWKR